VVSGQLLVVGYFGQRGLRRWSSQIPGYRATFPKLITHHWPVTT